MSYIEVSDLSKVYSVRKKKHFWKRSSKYEVFAVKELSFSITQGEIVGLLGPNGAGKTTVMKVLSGLLMPTSGRIRVNGFEPIRRQKEFLKSIALVMGQKSQLWWDLPAIETFRLHKEIFEISDSEYKQTLNELIEVLDIRDIINKQVLKMSLGERMRCEIAVALLHRPSILFLDEPTIGLDVVSQRSLWDFLIQYNKARGVTILLTSHNMDDVQELCKRILVIDHGKLFYNGPLTSLISKKIPYKNLTLIFREGSVSRSSLEKFGIIQEYMSSGRAVLRVERSQVSAIVAKLLQQFEFTDISITEMPLREVMRDIFVKQVD